MTLVIVLAVLAQSPEAEWSAPPLVSAPAEPPPPLPPAAAPQQVVAPAPSAEQDTVTWQVSAFGTATIPTSLDGASFMFGLRGELDVWRLGAVFTLDRAGVTPLTMNDFSTWTGLVGYSILSMGWLHVKAQAGLTALSSTTTDTARFSPTLGTSARVMWRFLGVEAAGSFSPFDFRQLDLRAAGILRGGIFELQVGYRARFLDATTTGTLDTMFTTAPSAGPHVSLGISL